MTRASIFFARSRYEDGWIAGSSPAMTTWVDTRAVSFCRALPDLLAPSERNPQLYEMATGAISLFWDCYLQ
jgi:hypothetical protein